MLFKGVVEIMRRIIGAWICSALIATFLLIAQGHASADVSGSIHARPGVGVSGVARLCTDPGYSCTTAGYAGQNTGWWGAKYGAGWASSNAFGLHNCTLYAAYRIAQNGVGNPGWSDNANGWARKAAAAGTMVNQNPAVGTVAQWNGGSAGHVAYVEVVTASYIEITDDNYGLNYTDRWRINFGSPAWPDNFIHFRDQGAGEGSFIRDNSNGQVFRIVGGAPIYVGSWDIYGGPQPVTDMTPAAIAGLPYFPADGTFVSAQPSGQVFRIVGGAPVYVGSWDTYGGPQPVITIGDDDVGNAGAASPWSHLRYYPVDGTFVSAQPSGQVFRIVGGAPVYVGSWDTYGGPQPVITIGDDDVRNAGAASPWSHLRYYPVDGTFISAQPTGQVFRIAGGAPIYVGSWDIYGGPQPVVTVSDGDVRNAGAVDAGNPWSHLRYYPVDGTFLSAHPSGRVYLIQSGAPVYVPNWESVGGPKPVVDVGDDDISNAGAIDPASPWSHLKRFVPGAFAALSPTRVLDTRSGQGGSGMLAAGGSISLQVTGTGGVPSSGVSAVAVNVTAVGPSASGYVTVWPSGTTRPNEGYSRWWGISRTLYAGKELRTATKISLTNQ